MFEKRLIVHLLLLLFVNCWVMWWLTLLPAHCCHENSLFKKDINIKGALSKTQEVEEQNYPF